MTLGINGIQRFFLCLTLFFCWFISFSVYNFEEFEWGLQAGWAFALLFCVVYMPSIIASRVQYFRSETFIIGRRILLIILGSTAISAALLSLGFIFLPDPDMADRIISHTVYILFYTVVYYCIYHALCVERLRYWFYFRWFFIYPFGFIGVWGIYQFLTTIGVGGEYVAIFNNNLSTGFTYERFRSSYRVSSVFPEPSEYSYFIALMGPIIWASYRNKIPWNGSSILGLFLVLVWLVAAVTVNSVSFWLALPVVIYSGISHVEGQKIHVTAIISIFLFSIFVVPILLFSFGQRIIDITTGADGSVIARFDGLIEYLDVFQGSPLFGFGYAVIRGLDAVSFLLASFGILGTVFLSVTIAKFIQVVRLNTTPVLSGAIVCLIAGCVLSNNVLDHLFVWVLLAVAAACPRREPSSPKDHQMGTFTPLKGPPQIGGNLVHSLPLGGRK